MMKNPTASRAPHALAALAFSLFSFVPGALAHFNG